MADWLLSPAVGAAELAGIDGAYTRIVSITAHASANTKGSYVELLASTARNYDAMMITESYCQGDADYLTDIAIGAAGSEQVIINNIIRSADDIAVHYGGGILVFPIQIPAGSRISARCQCSVGGNYNRYGITFLASNFYKQCAGIVDTYGAAAADSGGVSIDPGATADTKGAWVEISAGITRSAKFIILGTGAQGNYTRRVSNWFVDVGIGAAGSEQVLIPNLVFGTHTYQGILLPTNTAAIPVDIPAGTRLSVRAQCYVNDSADRKFDAVLYCIS